MVISPFDLPDGLHKITGIRYRTGAWIAHYTHVVRDAEDFYVLTEGAGFRVPMQYYMVDLDAM